MQYLFTTLAAFGYLASVLAQIEIDARFYDNNSTDDGCDDYATGCTDLAENSCCGVSQGGTMLYDSGDFYNTASGMGTTIEGSFFSRQNDNDCAVNICNNIDAGTCCNEQALTLTGASYSIPDKKRDEVNSARNTTCIAPDSHIWVVGGDKSYYVSMANEHKNSAVLAMRALGDATNLASFMMANADVVKSEAINAGPKFGRYRPRV